MAQKVLFPMKKFRLTQGRFDTPSHMNQNAYDFAFSGEKVPVYAPYDCKVVFTSDSYNAVAIESTSSVESPNGTSDQWMFFLHNDYMTVDGTASGKKLQKGDTFFRGERIYTMGEKGSEGSIHVHIQCGLQKWPNVSWPNSLSYHTNLEYCVYVPDTIGTLVHAYGTGETNSYTWTRTSESLNDSPSGGGTTDPEPEPEPDPGGGSTGGGSGTVSQSVWNAAVKANKEAQNRRTEAQGVRETAFRNAEEQQFIRDDWRKKESEAQDRLNGLNGDIDNLAVYVNGKFGEINNLITSSFAKIVTDMGKYATDLFGV